MVGEGAAFRLLLETSPDALVLVAPKDLGIGEHRETGGGHGEPPAEGAEERQEAPLREVAGIDQFGEAVDLALGIERHRHRPAVGFPGTHLGGELLPFLLLEDEVAGLERAGGIVVAGGGEILRPAGLRSRARHQTGRRERGVAFHRDHEIVRAEVVGETGLVLEIRFAEENLHRVEPTHRSLFIDIKFPQAVDVVAEQLDPHRGGGLPGKDIDNAPAHRELAALEDLGGFLVTCLQELGRKRRRVDGLSGLEPGDLVREMPRGGDILVEAGQAEHHGKVAPFMDFPQGGETLRRRLRVREQVFESRPFMFREEEGVAPPDGQFRMEVFLGFDVGTGEPDPAHGMPLRPALGDQAGVETVSGFRDMVEDHGAARRGGLQQVEAFPEPRRGRGLGEKPGRGAPGILRGNRGSVLRAGTLGHRWGRGKPHCRRFGRFGKTGDQFPAGSGQTRSFQP